MGRNRSGCLRVHPDVPWCPVRFRRATYRQLAHYPVHSASAGLFPGLHKSYEMTKLEEGRWHRNPSITNRLENVIYLVHCAPCERRREYRFDDQLEVSRSVLLTPMTLLTFSSPYMIYLSLKKTSVRFRGICGIRLTSSSVSASSSPTPVGVLGSDSSVSSDRTDATPSSRADKVVISDPLLLAPTVSQHQRHVSVD